MGFTRRCFPLSFCFYVQVLSDANKRLLYDVGVYDSDDDDDNNVSSNFIYLFFSFHLKFF